MTATTKVSPAEVHALSTFVSKKSQDIGDALAELDTKVQRLQGTWDGEAKEAYKVAQKKWSDQITEMNSLLSRIGGKLIEIGDGYDATDKLGRNRFSR